MVTGDSYLVHGTPVFGATGASRYMGKYLLKTFGQDRSNALGMARRWSTSRGWPGTGRLRLAQTDKGGWSRKDFRPGTISSERLGGPEWLLERSGDNLTLELSLKRKRLGMVSYLQRSLHVNPYVRA